MSSISEPIPIGLATLQRLFAESCERFREALGESESAADAIDFTGNMHNIALAAGRVQAFGETLTLLTGDRSWIERGNELLQTYINPGVVEI